MNMFKLLKLNFANQKSINWSIYQWIYITITAYQVS